MIIEVQPREVYGNVLYYPVNSIAEELAALMDRKTFTRDTLDRVAAIGLDVREVYGALTFAPSGARFNLRKGAH